MEVATISEPFLLSTYAVSPRLTKSKLQNVYVSHGEKASTGSDGYATVVAQGDGVHVLDLSTLHPVISHTLGPSTTFSCPAVTSSSQNACSTYAVIGSSSEISLDEAGRTIWMWREDLSSSTSLLDRAAQKKDKKTVVIPHLISKIYVADDRVLVLSPTGDLTITDADLKIQSTTPDSGLVLLKSFIFSQKACSFVPSSTPGTVIVSVLSGHIPADTTVKITTINGSVPNSYSANFGSCGIDLKPDQIANLSCSTSGYMSILTRKSVWHSFQLHLHSTDVSISPIGEPLHISSFSPIPCETSLIPLNTSHVLLAGLTNSSSPTAKRELTLLLWDLQYSVLLASHTLPVPSSLSQCQEISLELVEANQSQTLLVISPSASPSLDAKSQKSKAKVAPSDSSSTSSILVIPYTVPSTSTIANAMGRGGSASKWLVSSPSSSTKPPAATPQEKQKQKVLQTMRTAMEQNRPQVANKAFSDWAALPQNQDLSEYTRAFVQELLRITLRPSNTATNALYSSDVIRHLLGKGKGIVSAGMVEDEGLGGILDVLRVRGDWTSIQMALSQDAVLDIPEVNIISALKQVVSHHRSQSQARTRDVDDVDAMQIDSNVAESAPTDIPTLPDFLAHVISYPTSPAPLRLAIHEHLRDTNDIVSVLDVIEGWMDQWSKAPVQLLPPKKKAISIQPDLGIPPLSKILPFLQTLLDASFLALLQPQSTTTVASSAVLRRISAHLQPELEFNEAIAGLRGGLEVFSKASKAKTSEKARGDVKEDWRQRKKQVHEQTGLAIGLYRLEELVL